MTIGRQLHPIRKPRLQILDKHGSGITIPVPD